MRCYNYFNNNICSALFHLSNSHITKAKTPRIRFDNADFNDYIAARYFAAYIIFIAIIILIIIKI